MMTTKADESASIESTLIKPSTEQSAVESSSIKEVKVEATPRKSELQTDKAIRKSELRTEESKVATQFYRQEDMITGPRR